MNKDKGLYQKFLADRFLSLFVDDDVEDYVAGFFIIMMPLEQKNHVIEHKVIFLEHLNRECWFIVRQRCHMYGNLEKANSIRNRGLSNWGLLIHCRIQFLRSTETPTETVHSRHSILPLHT